VAEPRYASRRLIALATVSAIVLGACVGGAAPARGAPFPSLPVAYDATFLSNLSGPELTPGGSGTIDFHVGDPARFASMSNITLTLDVYAFNAFPGNATSSVATAGTPLLVTPTASATGVTVVLPSLTPPGVDAGSVGVATASDTPTGTFAVRTALSFLGTAPNTASSPGAGSRRTSGTPRRPFRTEARPSTSRCSASRG